MSKFWVSWDPLQRYNFVLFVIHLILTFVLYIYFWSVNNPNQSISAINIDLYDHVYILNPETNLYDVVSQKTKNVKDSDVTNMIVGYFGMTATFHLFYALNPGNVYLEAVKNKNNYFRWLEYTITATTMVVVIALLSGVKDIKAYPALVVASIGMISTGQWFEMSDGGARWIPIIVGFILLLGIFITIGWSFNDRLRDAKNAGQDIPSWLWLVVIILAVFYVSFGAVPVAQTIFGGNYRRYEYTYLTLSLLSKTSLGMFVGYGFGQRIKAGNPS